MGLTDQPIESLAPIARAWLQAPEPEVKSGDFSSGGYSRDERGFVLANNSPGKTQALELDIPATEESPIVNPAFVIKNWGESDVELSIDGSKVERGSDFRVGHYHTLEGSNLIVWLKMESMKPTKMMFAPASTS
jgi:hypothetical protein